MANLSASQKKKRNIFVALVVGIIVILAAILYISITGYNTTSSFLENRKLATALTEVFDSNERGITKENVASVKYLAISNNTAENKCTIEVGFDDFMKEYAVYSEQSDAASAAQAEKDELLAKEEEAKKAEEEAENAEEGEETAEEETAEESTETENTDAETAEEITEETAEPEKKSSDIVVPEITADPSKFLKILPEIETTSFNMDDLKYFTGVEMVYLENVTIKDMDVFANLKNLKNGSFVNCGITDVSAFASINLDKVEKLALMGNRVSDWKPLEKIADKVFVDYYYYEIEGYGMQPIMEKSLSAYLAELEAKNNPTTEEAPEVEVVPSEDAEGEEAEGEDAQTEESAENTGDEENVSESTDAGENN